MAFKFLTRILSVIIVVTLMMCLWILSQPTKIIAVYHNNLFIDVVVKNFPITASGRIQWWKDNDALIKEKYKIPITDRKYNVTVWGIGDGFEVRNDRQSKFLDFKRNEQYCFEQEVGEEKCIQKHTLLRVSYSFDGRVNYATKNTYYRENKKGELVAYE